MNNSNVRFDTIVFMKAFCEKSLYTEQKSLDVRATLALQNYELEKYFPTGHFLSLSTKKSINNYHNNMFWNCKEFYQK